MSTAAHTSGPWVSEATGVQPGAFSVVGDGNQMVALVYGETREAQAANTKLIDAAPDLLAACRDILNDQDVGCSHKGHHNCSFDAVRAAIAKAEGR